MGIDRIAAAIDRKRIPDLGKDAEDFHPDSRLILDQIRLIGNRTKRRFDVFVAGFLTTCQRPRISPQEWQVSTNRLRCQHNLPPNRRRPSQPPASFNPYKRRKLKESSWRWNHVSRSDLLYAGDIPPSGAAGTGTKAMKERTRQAPDKSMPQVENCDDS